MAGNQKPLLTIAVPTFRRSDCLRELLDVLAPQLSADPRVELIISDNASPDGTSSVVEDFRRRGLQCRYIRNEVNIGADQNFLQCYREASGEYFWLFGDDDILVPGGLQKIVSLLGRSSWDLAFIRPSTFRDRFDEIRRTDPFGRLARAVTSAEKFAELTGPMLTFISSVIVNKRKLCAVQAPDPALLMDSNLIQLGWVLPLLANYESGLIIFGGLVAGRMGNSGGYGLSRVFGQNLNQVVTNLLGHQPEIARRLLNATLRGWFPGQIVEARKGTAGKFGPEDYHSLLSPVFGANPRYWMFVYPAIKLPLALAGSLVKLQTGFLFRVQNALTSMAGLIFLRNQYLREA